MVGTVRELRGGLRAWVAYALFSLVIVAGMAGLATVVVDAASARAVWFSAGVAYTLQLPAFAWLVKSRNESELFLAGWLVGMVLRFGALGGVAWWLSRSAALPREAAMLSLVAFVFVLLIMEPIFLRWDLRKA